MLSRRIILRNMRLLTLSSFMLLSSVLPAAAANTQAAWVRSPAISPDGRTVAFSSRGQVRLVPVTGGDSVAITPSGAYSGAPTWSPDSRTLAFASDINGDADVYIASAEGGKMERRTFSSADEVPAGFSPDGKEVLYTAALLGDAVGSRLNSNTTMGDQQLYTTPTAGGRSHLLIPTRVDDAAWSRQGNMLVYSSARSGDESTRQRRLAGNAGELWLYNPATRQHTPFVKDGTEARSPVWSADGKAVYYLSERSEGGKIGVLNVWRKPLAGGAATQLTHYTDQPVEGLSVADDGTLAFTYAGKLQVMRPGEKPRTVAVNLPELSDDQEQNLLDKSSQELSADKAGKRFALTARGNIFLLDSKGQSYAVTQTPEEERSVSFSPDGTTLLYASLRREGGKLNWRLYKTALPKEASSYGNAGVFKETLLSTGEGSAQLPQFSPDGKKVAFVYERREVRVLDLQSGKVATLYKPSDYFTEYNDDGVTFNWSPDSRQLVVPWRLIGGGSTPTRWAVVPADGSGPLQPITEQVADLQIPEWTRDGRLLLAYTSRGSLRTLDGRSNLDGLYGLFMSEEARSDFLRDTDEDQDVGASDNKGDNKDGEESRQSQTGSPEEAKGNPKADPKNPKDGQEKEGAKGPKAYPFSPKRSDKLEGVLRSRGVDYFFPLKDSQYVLLVNTTDDGLDLSELNLRTFKTEDLDSVSLPDEPDSLLLSSDGEKLFALVGSKVFTISLDDPRHPRAVAFELLTRQTPSAVYRAAFDQAWLDLKQRFYRADMHGQDWDAVYNTYAPYLDGVATPTELRLLIGKMSGTLGASHLFQGSSSRRPQTARQDTDTGALGFFEDDSYTGPGRKIAAILPDGPLDRQDYHIQAGDVVRAIDAQPVPDLGGLERLLDGRVDKLTSVTLQRGSGDKAQVWTVRVKPISLSAQARLNAQRITEWRRERVRELSGGKLAYVYLPAMENNDLITAYNALLTMQDERTGAVVDVRGNAGGHIDQNILSLLTGKVNQWQGKEGRPWQAQPEERWTKPSALLVDPFSYSDGSILPQVYQDTHVGPLVGQSLVNTGTAISWTKSVLVPGLRYSIPVLPLRRLDGSYYENREIQPDIALPHDPNLEQRGIDAVLEAGVKALLKK